MALGVFAAGGLAVAGYVRADGVRADANTEQDFLLDEDLDSGVIKLQRSAGALLLSTTLGWTLPELVKDVLHKGIPVHFIAEALMFRERWYWRDEKLLQAERFMRLSYQPLTRRWRLYTGSHPFEGRGLGVAALGSTFDTLEDAVRAMRRLARWRIGDASEIADSGEAWLQLKFRVDLSQFPRPLQIGVFGRSDWDLLVTRRVLVNLGLLQ